MRALRPRSPSATTTALMKGRTRGLDTYCNLGQQLCIALEPVGPRDQSDAALERHVGPRPFSQHDNPVAESDQPEDVEEQPEHPGEPPRYPHRADVDDHRAATHGGDVAVV